MMDTKTSSEKRRILVAYDARVPAREALKVAVETARRTGGRLMLVNVVPGATGAEGGQYVCSLERLDQQHIREAARMLCEVRKTLPASIECEQLVYEGEPAAEILRAARRWGADLIVMGARPHGRLFRFLVGSTTEEVTRRATCQVTAVGLEEACGHDARGGSAESVAPCR
jgi:nucleotide-binding universal stress UspA family protein